MVSAGRRARWVAGFALLLFASSSVPVFAEPLPDEAGSTGTSAEISSPSPEPASVQLPDAEDIRGGIEASEAEEAAHERWLASPEAVREREESRQAFAELSSAETEDLFLELFSEQLQRLNADP